MKRLGCLLLLCALFMLDMGCRRRASTPQKPLEVLAEKDVIAQRDKQDMDRFKPIPKKRKVVLSSNNFKPSDFDDDAEISWDVQDEAGKLMLEKWRAEFAAAKKIVADKKSAAERVVLKGQLREVGLLFLDFCKTNPPTERNLDNFRSFIRRGEQPLLYDLMTKKKIEAVLYADTNINDDIIAYAPATGDLGPTMMWSNKADGDTTTDDLQQRLNQQQLKALRLNFAAYQIELRKNNAFNQLNLDGFKKYLKGNASPALAALLEDRTILMLDPRVPPGTWVALQAKEVQKKGNLAVASNGGVDYVPKESAKGLALLK